jgi:tetratricopeptide (TPR) repeat protein
MKNISKEEKLKADIQVIINYLNVGSYDDVVNKSIPLIKKYPETYILKNLLALAYNAQNKYEEAIKVLDNAIRNDPNNIFILNNLGLVHSNLGNTKIAEEYLNRAIAIKPLFLDASITLANLKSKIDKNKEAIEILLKLESTYKDSFILNFTMGNIYQQIGNFDKATYHLSHCLKLDPQNTAPDKAISLITKYTPENNHLHDMQKKFETIKSSDHKMILSFALGKAYEDIKEYKKSFQYLDIANKIRDEQLNFNVNDEKKLFLDIKNFFKNKSFVKIKPSNKKIIFILGMPRSGTSLIEQILSSHRQVHGAGELNHISNFIEKNSFLNDKNLNEKKLLEFQNYYIEKLDTQKNIVTDKAPLNFKWIGFLLTTFPNCKIIHSVRDPMDICWSMFKNFFLSKKLNFCYSLENLGKYYLLYEELMKFWKNEFGDKIYDIGYENLIKNQDTEVKKLLKYCELDWDENCMTFYKNKKSVATASLAQVRSPIYNSSVQKWKNYSSELNELLQIIKK